MISAVLISLLPLIGALVASGIFTHMTDRVAQITTSTCMMISALLSWYLFCTLGGDHYMINLASWLNIGSFHADWSLYIDSLTALMFIVVTTVSAVVHFYSIGYMHDDPNIKRFFAYISFFTFCMLMLVSSDNFVQLFFGWEGVGLCSYLLIGFWFKKETANHAAMKAFIINRVGDLGLVLGIAFIYLIFNSVKFADVFANVHLYEHHITSGIYTLNIICLLLFIGCMGKSAQVGLHTWLPDAMEGPTPVSALIHAATMVTAGVFLLARCSPLFELAPVAREVIVIIGAITCLMAATMALVQQDIKKIIAYSTCSQLGYMFMACGLSAYGIAMFHLATHAFFKALLFLCAGNIIHSMSGEQNINKMEPSLWKKLPITYSLMWIASLALAGIFPFAGFYSKDLILEVAYNQTSFLAPLYSCSAGDHSCAHNFAYFIGMIVVLLTAFYSWRLIIKVFHNNQNKVDVCAHESSRVMLWPLYVLAILSVISGFIGEKLLHITTKDFWSGAIELIKTPHIHYFGESTNVSFFLPDFLNAVYLKASYFLDVNFPTLLSISGIVLAYFKFKHSEKKNIFSFILWSLCILLFKEEIVGLFVVLVLIFTLGVTIIKSNLILSAIALCVALIVLTSIVILLWNRKSIAGYISELARNKYYFDKIYELSFIQGAKYLGSKLWKAIDIKIVDNLGPNGISRLINSISGRIVRLQTGFVFDYTLSMLLGIVLILGLFMYILR